MWNEEQDNRHRKGLIKVNHSRRIKCGRKNKTKWREVTSPFGASKRKLNPSGGDIPVKVGSGKMADLTRVE